MVCWWCQHYWGCSCKSTSAGPGRFLSLLLEWWERMRCSNGRGLWLLDSFVALPSFCSFFFLLPASSFARLSDVHHVLLCECDFRKYFWWQAGYTTCRLQLLPDFSLSPSSLSSVLIWRGGKEKEHAIFQVSSPSRILRLATAFRQAAVDRLEKRNNKNLAWQHLMLRWTTWWEWDQTCLGLGGWLGYLSGFFWQEGQDTLESCHANLLRYFRLHWDFFYFRVRYVCTYSTWYIYYL